MKYTPPTDDNGNPYYVPVVAKNRDFLTGYLKGLMATKDILNDVMTSLNINIDVGPIDAVLDSTRFNDILENGKRESDMTEDELNDYIMNIVTEVTNKMVTNNPENNIYDDDILTLECSCDYGFLSLSDVEKIPHENCVCPYCGKILIHYTGIDDYQYEFDGGKNDTEKN